jgi:hypothetical protein
MINNRDNTFTAIPLKFMLPLRPLAPVGPVRPLAAMSPPAGLGQPLPPSSNTERDINPRPVEALKSAFVAIGLNVKECYSMLQPPSGQFGPICLTYHGTGGCFTGCDKARSLKPLVSKGFWIVLPYAQVRSLPGLRISPMAVVPQRDRRP